MKFGPLPVEEAVGCLAAHSVSAGNVSLRKGNAISADIVGELKAAGIETIVAVRLDADDVGENEAAAALARAVAGHHVRVDPPFTGRANLFSNAPGLLIVERDLVDDINAIDEAVTIATLPAYRPVVEGEMIATIKIIPYGVDRAVLAHSLSRAAQGPAIAVAPYRLKRVGVIATLTASLKPSIVAKTTAILRDRLAPASAEIVSEATCGHETEALRRAIVETVDRGAELVVIFGASAIADRRDVIPSAIEAAGGRIEHFGMPVDPGNLILIGEIDGIPVIGAPGCARSPKENGFDWVLARLLAGLVVTRREITRLGVGGLLMEIVSRGQPRDGRPSTDDE